MGRAKGHDFQAQDIFFGEELAVSEASEEHAGLSVLADGTKEWRLHGELHREDGPARIRLNGDTEYWRHGKRNAGDPAKPVVVYHSNVGKRGAVLAQWVSASGADTLSVRLPIEDDYNHKFMMDAILEHDWNALEYLGHLAKEVGPLKDIGIGSLEWLDEKGRWHREGGPACVTEYVMHWMEACTSPDDALESRKMSQIKTELEAKYGREY